MCRPRLSFNLQPGREQYGEVTNVRFTPESGLNSDISPCPLWADAVEKVFLGVRANFYRGAGAAVRK